MFFGTPPLPTIMIKSFSFFAAIAALGLLALLSSVVNAVFGLLEWIGYTVGISKITEAQAIAAKGTFFAFPFSFVSTIVSLFRRDVANLVQTIETAYGSIRWRCTGTVKHFPQYAADRIEPCPALLTRVAADAGVRLHVA